MYGVYGYVYPCSGISAPVLLNTFSILNLEKYSFSLDLLTFSIHTYFLPTPIFLLTYILRWIAY